MKQCQNVSTETGDRCRNKAKFLVVFTEDHLSPTGATAYHIWKDDGKLTHFTRTANLCSLHAKQHPRAKKTILK